MDMNRNKKFVFGLLLLAVVQHEHKVSGSPRIFSRDAELYGGQESQSPRTDMELNLENLKQQQANFVRKQQQSSTNNNNNNGPDAVSPLSQYPPARNHQLKLNQQQQQQQLASPSLYNQASSQQFPVQQLQFEDEHAMRRQLPDLIAQAHTDKNVERALLKMLISASLRSALTNSQAFSSGSGGGGGGGYAWRLDGGDGETGSLDNGAPSRPGPAMSARLEQVIDEFASGVDPLAMVSNSNDFGGQSYKQPQELHQYGGGQPAAIGKREYVKPCFFNAISCAKNPFRDTS